MEHDLTPCPECGVPAEIQDRRMLPSTDGPTEHAKIRCLAGHWFFMELAALPAQVAAAA